MQSPFAVGPLVVQSGINRKTCLGLVLTGKWSGPVNDARCRFIVELGHCSTTVLGAGPEVVTGAALLVNECGPEVSVIDKHAQIRVVWMGDTDEDVDVFDRPDGVDVEKRV